MIKVGQLLRTKGVNERGVHLDARVIQTFGFGLFRVELWENGQRPFERIYTPEGLYDGMEETKDFWLHLEEIDEDFY